jgi:acylphosphatase
MPPRGGAGGCKVKIRERFIFKGDVQGVGFRFRAYHAANVLGLTGFVRNEYDGSVLLEAQGDPRRDRRTYPHSFGRTVYSYRRRDFVRSAVDDGERAFTISD